VEISKQLTTYFGTLDLSSPKVMGVMNLTPDSFYDGGKYKGDDGYLHRIGQMLKEGADIIDLGAVSTRPGAFEVNTDEELHRLMPILEKIKQKFPEIVVSVDTYRSKVAREAIAAGAHIINDISGGRFDPEMFSVIAALKVPYILMHIKGTPRDMQKNPQYVNVVSEVTHFFIGQLNKLAALGVKNNVVIDPGFGFGKTAEHNFQLLSKLGQFKNLNCPIMVGVSRKSMINKIVGTIPESALNGTTVVNTIALLNGAGLLRVHDVKEAVEAVKLVSYYKSV